MARLCLVTGDQLSAELASLRALDRDEDHVLMAELAQFMGHDDDRTTQKHYARFSPNYLRSVADAIGKRA